MALVYKEHSKHIAGSTRRLNDLCRWALWRLECHRAWVNNAAVRDLC